MLAAVLREYGKPLTIEDRPVPEAHGDQVLLRVLGAGVCGTDLHMAAGRITVPLPIVLGHEIAGRAEGFGNVIVFASWGCGDCDFCLGDREQLCRGAAEPGWVVDGGFQQWLVVPNPRYLVPLGDLAPAEAAPLADAGVTAYRAVRRETPWLDEASTVIVIGAGGLGQFAVQFLRGMGVGSVIVVEPDRRRQNRGRLLGADVVLSPDTQLPSASVVFDFVGTNETLACAVSAVERGGLVVLVGEAGGRYSFGFGLVPHEAQLTTSVWGSRSDLLDVVKLAQERAIEWHVDQMRLEQANEALDRLRRGDTLGRIVLVPEGELAAFGAVPRLRVLGQR